MNYRFAARRLFVITVAIAIASALLRPQLASALVTRGDDLSYRGDTTRALGKYRLALRLDPRSSVAADRYAFAAIELHDARSLERAVVVLTRAIGRSGGKLELVMDRALCYQKLRDYARASRDFERAGRRQRDARALLFAALDNEKLGKAERARAILREAVTIDPSFKPAKQALVRSVSWLP